MNDGEDTSQNGLRHHHGHLLYCIRLGIVLFVDVQCSNDINHLARSLTVIWLTVLLTYITGLGWQGSPPPTPRLHPERATHIHTINQDVRISIICRVRRSIDALINVLFSYVCRHVYLDYRKSVCYDRTLLLWVLLIVMLVLPLTTVYPSVTCLHDLHYMHMLNRPILN